MAIISVPLNNVPVESTLWPIDSAFVEVGRQPEACQPHYRGNCQNSPLPTKCLSCSAHVYSTVSNVGWQREAHELRGVFCLWHKSRFIELCGLWLIAIWLRGPCSVGEIDSKELHIWNVEGKQS